MSRMQRSVRPKRREVNGHTPSNTQHQLATTRLMHRAIAKQHHISLQVVRDLFENARKRWAASLLFTVE